MLAKALHRSARCSPRKVRRTAAQVIGMNVNRSLYLLKQERRSGSVVLIKLIKAAVAQLSTVDFPNAVIQNIIVNQGQKRVMFMPRARGRASPIEKKTSHILVQIKA